MINFRSLIPHVAVLCGLCLGAPASALASPLLSGYGGPGQGSQVILGSALVNGPRWSGHSKDSFHGWACIGGKVPEYVPPMTYRVIQWATGTVGIHAVPAIAAHPDLELAGLWVHSDSKAG